VKGIQLIIYFENILTAQKDCVAYIDLCIIIIKRANKKKKSSCEKRRD
jgi:hypothetical protein